MSTRSEDVILVSGINQYSYCPRRYYLVHGEQEFQDNIHTLRGTHEHGRVDQTTHDTVAGVRVEYAVPIWNQRLGLTGRCDVVEFHPDGRVVPVEYKHGKRKKWVNDDLQLVAQAVCLEEMLDVSISQGAIYHQQSRRRREVVFDNQLRAELERTVSAMRAMLLNAHLPPPTSEQRRCPECSLLETCQPDLARANNRVQQLRNTLFSPEDMES